MTDKPSEEDTMSTTTNVNQTSLPTVETPDEEPTPEAEVADAGLEGAEPVEPGRGGEDEPAESKPAREAARYRRQLREVEAERDGLREMLTVARRAAVEREAASPIELERHVWVRLTHPSDAFTLAGLDPVRVHAEDGTLDKAAVGDALRALHAERPDLFSPARNPNGAVGPIVPTQGDTPEDGVIRQGFASAFGPRD